MKRLWLFTLVALFACASFLLAEGTSPKMSIDQLIFDAGELYTTAGKIEHSFIIKNTGGSNLHIFKAAPS